MICEEKGEIFRKSLCCVPPSDSESDGVACDDEKTARGKQGKIEENSVNESTERKKKESRRKVLSVTVILLFLIIND